MSDRFAVVMAGGSGTRFWPMSRAHVPKQLLPLLGPRSMIRETVDRLFPLFSAEQIFVVCGRSQKEAIERELSPRQREVLVAVALNGVPIDVLAERMDTTRGALYKMIHDARKKLRLHLAEAGLEVDSGAEEVEYG